MKSSKKIRIFSNAMTTSQPLLICYLLLVGIQACDGQVNSGQNICNRKTVDRSLDKRLAKGICVPQNYTIDEIIRNVDFNKDLKLDVIVRYGEYPLKNGTTRHYAFFERVSDTSFVLRKELKNITLPYLKNIYAATSGNDTLAARLVRTYPYDLQIRFISDTIKLSHLIPDYYGKTYEFVFDTGREDWYLKRIKYWIGGLDPRDIEQLDLSSKLINRNIVEVKKPEREISITTFSLLKSRRDSDSDEKDLFMDTYNLFEWSKKN